MMRSASREASVRLRRSREELVAADDSAESLIGLGKELYSVASLLVTQSRLRRALGDPATAPDSRVELANRLLGGKISAVALSVSTTAVQQRWSSPWDLADAMELSGDDMLFAAAEREGVLRKVEDELFRFERVLDASAELTTLLDDRSVDMDRRVRLLTSVLAGKVHPITAELLEHAVRSDRTRSVVVAIDDLLEAAAERQSLSVARVSTAVELSEQQRQRLSAALTALYGRPISLRTAIDPKVRGGLVVRVGDEVIDGSIAARLVGARTALAG